MSRHGLLLLLLGLLFLAAIAAIPALGDLGVRTGALLALWALAHAAYLAAARLVTRQPDESPDRSSVLERRQTSSRSGS
jgi:hypothetical protein